MERNEKSHSEHSDKRRKNAEKYSEPCQRSKMELFVKMAMAQKPLTIFAKCSVLDVWQGSEYNVMC